MPQLFITGTDTNIGKTLVSSILVKFFSAYYFKPVQTGINDGSDEQEVQYLAAAPLEKIIPAGFSFCQPLAPSIAAKYENKVIHLNKIQKPDYDPLIVEGAGGVFVPLNDKHYMIDVIKKFNIPTIIVSRTALGTINHTLLTIHALHEARCPVMGIVLSGEPNLDTQKSIELHGKVPVLFNVPHIHNITPETVGKIASTLPPFFNEI